jgi:enediyne biosynthesis protein E8
VQPDPSAEEQVKITTLEAYADTIVPGEKRFPDDRAIAGVSEGAGAVAAGAIELLHEPAAGVTDGLPYLAVALNNHAKAYAEEQGIELDDMVPPFVALSYEDRAALVLRLTAPGHPEREGWVVLAQYSSMAFDIAPHLHTTEAMAAGHPGMLQMGYYQPDDDGLWRFPQYSYGIELAKRHPDTDLETGSLP